MSRQVRALAVFCAAVGTLAFIPGGRAGASVMTQTSTLQPTTTDFTSGSSDVNPLTFSTFNTMGGSRVLDSVTLNFSAQVTNGFSMTFTNPATLTESFATGNATTPGSSITLFEPDGKTSLVTAQEPNDPSVLSRSVTYSGPTFPVTYSSDASTASAFLLQPSVATATGSRTLTDAASLALFTQTGTNDTTISLPVSASAFSTFSSSSGNGSGSVSSKGTASVTVSYTWHNEIPSPQTVPEPSTVLLWSAGGFALMLAHRNRRRA